MPPFGDKCNLELGKLSITLFIAVVTGCIINAYNVVA